MFLKEVDKVGKKAYIKSKKTSKRFKVELWERNWKDPKFDLFIIYGKKDKKIYRDSLRRRYYEF